jgi:hypothetical protein
VIFNHVLWRVINTTYYGPKHDISKRHLKIGILTRFLKDFFYQKSNQKNLKATCFDYIRQMLKIQFIHQSIALNEFSRNMLLLNFFEVKSGQKILKTMLKYLFLNDVLKYHVLGLKSVKKEGF